MTLKLFKKDRPPIIEFRKAFTLSVYFVRPWSNWDLYAWAIRLFIWAPYCHTAIGFKDFIFESVARGAVWTSLKRFNAKNKVIAKFDIQLNQTQYTKLCALCKTVEKTPYDWRAVMGLAMTRLRALFGSKSTTNVVQNGRRYMFCSELAYILLCDLGILDAKVQSDFLDPKRFLRYLEAAKDARIVRKF